MVVLGGVSILGGSGTIPGVVIAAFVMGLVTFGFGLLNVPGIVMSIFIGLLLIGVIALPRLWSRFEERMMQKYAFTMRLNPGMEDEYRKRHDAIWPELVALLKDAGVSDYSIHLDRDSRTLFGVLWRTDDTPDGRPARIPGDAALVGAYGRHHAGEARQRTRRHAAGDGVPHAMTRPALIGPVFAQPGEDARTGG